MRLQIKLAAWARGVALGGCNSVNLNGNIHMNYNGWIQNLTRGINAQLLAS